MAAVMRCLCPRIRSPSARRQSRFVYKVKSIVVSIKGHESIDNAIARCRCDAVTMHA